MNESGSSYVGVRLQLRGQESESGVGNKRVHLFKLK